MKEFYELLTQVADMILKNGDEVEITCEHEDEDSNVVLRHAVYQACLGLSLLRMRS